MKILILFITLSLFASSGSAIDKGTYYKTLSSNNESEIDKALKVLAQEDETAINKAYRGALISKKADFASFPADKLKLFKRGVTMIEDAIEKAPENIEFRFLRLVIQENSPGFVGYKDNIEEDKNLIYKHFSRLEKSIQTAIKDYAKNSEFLAIDKLK